MMGSLTRLTFEAAAHPPLCADFHVTAEALKYFEDTYDTEMTGDMSVT